MFSIIYLPVSELDVTPRGIFCGTDLMVLFTFMLTGSRCLSVGELEAEF